MSNLEKYEYRGLMAEAWDLLRGDTSGWPDRRFYLELIAHYGQPVLDVGCGTGRLLLDYLAQGIDIDGVDNSPEMLALCREKAAEQNLSPTLYLQEMEHLDLPRRYRTIMVPSSSLQLVVDPDVALGAVRRLYAHLEPGGRVVASFMWLRRPGEPLELRFESSANRPEDGAVVRRESWSLYDPATETEETEDRYQILLDGQVAGEETHRRTPATRSYTHSQARDLFERAGLVEVQLLQGFTSAPATSQDWLFTAIGRRGEAP